jgi:DNA modification methylase
MDDSLKEVTKLSKQILENGDKWDSPQEYIDFVFAVCEEYKRILKPNASMVLFFSYQYS